MYSFSSVDQRALSVEINNSRFNLYLVDYNEDYDNESVTEPESSSSIASIMVTVVSALHHSSLS